MEQKLKNGSIQPRQSPIILFPFSSRSLIKTTVCLERKGWGCSKVKQDMQVISLCIWSTQAPIPCTILDHTSGQKATSPFETICCWNAAGHSFVSYALMVSCCHKYWVHFGTMYRCPKLQQRPQIFWQVLNRRGRQCLSTFIHIPEFLSFSRDTQLRKIFLKWPPPLWSPAKKALKQKVRGGINVTEETMAQAECFRMKNPPVPKAPRKT